MSVSRQPSAPNPAGWRNDTRQQIAELQTANFTQFGQTQTIQINQVGLLANLWLTMSGSVTTGTGTATGSFPVYPESPWNLIKQVRIYSSQGVDLMRCSGKSLVRYNRMKRRNNNITANPSNDFLSSNNFTAMYKALSGSAAASTAYPVALGLKLPIETDDWLMWGMLLLQNDNVRLYVDLTLGSQSDICGTIAGVSLTPNVTVSVASEFFGIDDSVPNPPMPDLSMIRTLIEEVFPFSNTGDVIYQPTRGQVYTGIQMQFENNGAPLSQANINNTRIVYAQNVNPYYETYQHHVLRNLDKTGVWLPDGCILYDFGSGYGIPEIEESRDYMNTSQQTDFRIITNITGITPTNAQIVVLKDQLGITPM